MPAEQDTGCLRCAEVETLGWAGSGKTACEGAPAGEAGTNIRVDPPVLSRVQSAARRWRRPRTSTLARVTQICTVLQQDGPNHLGLWLIIALIRPALRVRQAGQEAGRGLREERDRGPLRANTCPDTTHLSRRSLPRAAPLHARLPAGCERECGVLRPQH